MGLSGDRKQALIGLLLVLVPALSHFAQAFFGISVPDLGHLGDILNLGSSGLGSLMVAKSDAI